MNKTIARLETKFSLLYIPSWPTIINNSREKNILTFNVIFQLQGANLISYAHPSRPIFNEPSFHPFFSLKLHQITFKTPRDIPENFYQNLTTDQRKRRPFFFKKKRNSCTWHRFVKNFDAPRLVPRTACTSRPPPRNVPGPFSRLKICACGVGHRSKFYPWTSSPQLELVCCHLWKRKKKENMRLSFG